VTATHVNTIEHLDLEPVLECDSPDCDELAVLVQRPTEHYVHKHPRTTLGPLLLCANCWEGRLQLSRTAGPMTCCCGQSDQLVPLYIQIERWL